MFTRLERNTSVVLVMMALCAALVLALPAPAQAQAAPTTEDAPDAHANPRGNLSHAIVRPGDSLWTISKEQLGPDATPQRIANGVEQIYALNRGRIGADPNLIVVGQELLVPPAMSERPTGAPPAHGSAEAGSRDRVAEGNTAKEAKPPPKTETGGAAQGAAAEGAGASETPVHRSDRPVRLPALPEEASVAPVTVVTVAASNEVRTTAVAAFLRMIRTEFASAASTLVEVFSRGSADTQVEGRRLLGLGVLALTFVVAVLIALKLPMRRTTLKDAERWGIAASYYGEMPMAERTTPFAYHPGSLGSSLVGSLGSSLVDSDETPAGWDTRSRAPAAVAGVRRISFMARPGRKGGTTNGRRRPAPKAEVRPRNSLALGAHNPEVRRVPRRAHAMRRSRKLHPRRLTASTMRQLKGGAYS